MYVTVYCIRPFQDERLRIEIEFLRKSLNRKELYNIDWIDKINQIPGSVTISSFEKILNSFKKNCFSINKQNIIAMKKTVGNVHNNLNTFIGTFFVIAIFQIEYFF